eukprot:TRINITY_DN19280_c0_g3_i1.p3 TRINITY_DN19280_c0_g3~~TRINITY_DN19280_c0_g3_i1.p3  ORF type:complete len:196 (-),score=-0.97 TRINITY_DN19280_c0_g3_i1:798-1385(-)
MQFVILLLWSNITAGVCGDRLLQSLKKDSTSASSDVRTVNELVQQVLDKNEQWTNLNLTGYSFNITSECMHCIEPFNFKQETIIFCNGNYQLLEPNVELDIYKEFLQSFHQEPFYKNNIDTMQNVFDRALQLLTSQWNEIDIFFHLDYFFPYFIQVDIPNENYNKQGSLTKIGSQTYNYYVTGFTGISPSDCISK